MAEGTPASKRESRPPDQAPSPVPPAGEEPYSGEEEIRYPDGRIEHPLVRREQTDVSVRGIAAALLAGCCLAALLFYLMWRFFFQPELRLQAEIKRSRYAIPTIAPLKLPPQPRLEQLHWLEGQESSNVYERMQARLKVLDSYGPTSEPGFVHIPIDKAMELTAGQLPVRKQPPPQPAKDNGLVDGGGPNSGRMFRGEPQ
jgi:hypothetical protein